jgi:hypothetical protein
MVIDRRSLLAGIGAAVSASLLPRLAYGAADALYISAVSDGKEHAVAMFTAEGQLRFASLLPDRGHDAVRHPSEPRVVIFARRPGNWAAVVNIDNGAVEKVLLSPQGRHFYGHGAFSRDGRLLYATENDVAAGAGLLGIYDAGNGYARIGEMPSFGVGPHDLLFRPGLRHMVVANGGIRTHPDSGREMLNRDDMEPSLAVVDIATGELATKIDFGADLKGLSIRHLAMADDGVSAFGCQFEGDPFEMPSLVGLLMPDGTTRMLEMPDEDRVLMNNYVGSMALDRSGEIVAATCPRGDMTAFWERTTGRYLDYRRMPDVCGVAAGLQDGHFVLTSGNAGVRMADMSSENLKRLPTDGLGARMWDNHLLRL